ncbi:hypothetical protein [Oceanobacillus kimchii]|uniref:Uncharacterized protein n=1 Tax=Oceanobacillus kimchii TaxID=746691 RepID=A0ABQ5TL04_9BACI|nr:hypothetical protein [Oceanobacillus kimchii]GLO66274.1 hypothetical protein MACH08_20580 [Oceanobacillus kimchii]
MNELNLKVTKDGWKLQLNLNDEEYIQESQMIDENTASAPTLSLDDLLEDGIINEELYELINFLPMSIAMELAEI